MENKIRTEVQNQINELRNRVFNSENNKRLCYNFRNWKILEILDYPEIIKNLFGIKSKFFTTVDVVGCPSRCYFCWAPREEEITQAKFYSSNEIIEEHLRLKGNIWRISGGEPLIVPETIFDLLNYISEKNLSKVLWLETNLLPIVAFPELPKQLAQYKRILVLHPSIKGVDLESFEQVTTLDGRIFPYTLEALNKLIENGIEVYPSFLANTVEPSKLQYLFQELKKIHPKLPLRIMIREVLPHRVTIRRMKKNFNDLYSFKECLQVWDSLLFEEYGLKQSQINRWEIKL